MAVLKGYTQIDMTAGADGGGEGEIRIVNAPGLTAADLIL